MAADSVENNQSWSFFLHMDDITCAGVAFDHSESERESSISEAITGTSSYTTEFAYEGKKLFRTVHFQVRNCLR